MPGTFIPLNLEGTNLPNDWYLRLAAAATRSQHRMVHDNESPEVTELLKFWHPSVWRLHKPEGQLIGEQVAALHRKLYGKEDARTSDALLLHRPATLAGSFEEV